MFVVPEYILKHLGLLMGHAFNIFLVGVGVTMCINFLNEGDIPGLLFSIAFTLAIGAWTIHLIRAAIKREREKEQEN
ncbi:hypothetical protein SAMN04488134_1045 [Amphibacillus marinus]|uniref:Uncharacterized protein n=1 Tax=Amphibacillus marinus TaxID=872970 RepID=A0A1H8M288_9BACI|nr:hypothetical protein [Amphibacillus marinus]SEO11493.1 hypothetical protein SAMN04488134_1045 [Amphibacillus marinus]